MTAWRSVELHVEPPFNYRLSLEATPPLPPLKASGGLLQRCLILEGVAVPVRLRFEGGIEDPRADLLTPSWVGEYLVEEALRRAMWMTCAELRLEEAYRAADSNPRLARLVEELRGLKPWLAPEPWEGLASSVVFQQVSLRAAYAMLSSLVQRLGTSIEVEGEVFKAFPTPL
ncbi:MAG: hypothetical protein DRJ97_08130, partial [Thermoprotei archaeon]